MKRLYYLTKDIETTEAISNDIHTAGITDLNFHVLSKNEKGLYQRHIHSASLLQKTDLIHSIEQGLLRGLTIGLGLTLVLLFIPIHGSILSNATLVAIVLASILLGGWHGSLFGYQSENVKLKPYHDKIEQGFYLIMIDVAPSQERQIVALMEKDHPDATFCDQDTTIVTPFDKPRNVNL